MQFKRLIPAPMKNTIRGSHQKLQDLLELWREKTFRPYIVKKATGGVSFRFLIGDLQGKRWYDSGEGHDSSESSELKFLSDHLIRPGDIVFECGGHHGWTAIVLSRYVGDNGKVITFEPHPNNVRILRQNLALNDIKNVMIEQRAVGPRDERATVTNMSDTIVKPDRVDERFWPENAKRKSILKGVEVGMVSLDTYARTNDLYPTVLKVDVEGYEVEVLKGAREVLSRIPRLALEIHHPDALARYGTSAADLLELVDFGRYETWILRPSEGRPMRFNPGELTKHSERVSLFAIPA